MGTGKTVTVSAITLSDGSNGGLASNYSKFAGKLQQQILQQKL